jgi:hypothetical protein
MAFKNLPITGRSTGYADTGHTVTRTRFFVPGILVNSVMPESRSTVRYLSADAERVAMLLIRLVALAGAMSLLAWTTADPDLWGHVRFGLDTLRDLALTRRDPYSFTSDRVWINHEWLAEVIMAVAYRVDGARGLVALKLVIIGITLVFVVIALRRRVWDPISHDVLVGVAIFGILGRVHPVRPQLFSVLLCAALLTTVVNVDRGRRRLLVLIPVLLGVWANLHGGYLVGIGILAIWTAFRVVRSDTHQRQRLEILGVALLSVIATLATPYGVGLWSFLWETVGATRVGIADWAPLLGTSPLMIAQWVVVTATAVLALRGRQVDAAYASMAVVLGLATLMVSRFDAFYALAVVMLLGPCLGRAPKGPVRTWYSGATVAAVGALAISVVVFAERSSCIEMRTGPEAEATTFARDLRGRMLTFFDWGQYAIWHLAPAIQVSMDGRRETVYSDSVTQSHMRIYTGSPDAVALVEAMRPDWIWFPREWPVIPRLEAAGWHIAFRGPVSVILGRQPGATLEIQARDITTRCFPER